MTLWDRIARWRGDEGIDRSIPAIDPYDAGKLNARLQCAADLEADLRELREVVDKLIEAGQEFRQKAVMVNLQTREVDIGALTAMNQAWDAARCALDARGL